MAMNNDGKLRRNIVGEEIAQQMIVEDHPTHVVAKSGSSSSDHTNAVLVAGDEVIEEPAARPLGHGQHTEAEIDHVCRMQPFGGVGPDHTQREVATGRSACRGFRQRVPARRETVRCR